MLTYNVISKATGEVVYRYNSPIDSPIPFSGYEFATHDHIADGIQEVVSNTVTVWTIAEFKRRLTTEERIAIRETAKTDPVVEDILDILNSVQDGVYSNDSDLQMGLKYLVMVGVLQAHRPSEIMGG